MTNLQLPDKLARQIRDIADSVGVSVPDLLARLLANYQRRSHRAARRAAQRHSTITALLDAVYANQPSTLDPVLLKLQWLSLGREQW